MLENIKRRRKLEEQAPKRRKKAASTASAPPQPVAALAAAPAPEAWAKVRSEPHSRQLPAARTHMMPLLFMLHASHTLMHAAVTVGGRIAAATTQSAGWWMRPSCLVTSRQSGLHAAQVPKSQKKKQKGKSLSGQQLGFSSGVNYEALERIND